MCRILNILGEVMETYDNELDEIVVILGDDGITPVNSISQKTCKSYKLLGNNKMRISEKSGVITTFNIEPYNEHVLRIVTRWIV